MKNKLARVSGTMAIASALAVTMAQNAFAAAIDWTTMTSGLQSSFESAVTTVLPTVGVIVAAFLAYKAIRKFVKA